jgi:hypothetical protein
MLKNIAPERLNEQFYVELNEAKTNIQANLDIGIEGIIIKDFKKYQNGEITFGVSSACVPLQSLKTTFKLSGLCNAITHQMILTGS